MFRAPNIITIPLAYRDKPKHSLDRASLWEFQSWPPEFLAAPLPPLPMEWEKCAKELFDALNDCGYSVIDTSQIFEHSAFPSVDLVQFLSLVAIPIRVFKSLPLWRAVDVDLDRPANSSRGVGYLPIHMDFVNAELPPEYIVLLCLEPDPHGGGSTIVCNVEGITTYLSSFAQNVLRNFKFDEGKVLNLENVGNHHLFTVISHEKRFPLRYTEKLLQQLCPPEVKAALTELNQLVTSKLVKFQLMKYHMLVIDQRKVLHGREPLAEINGKVSKARLLMQLFLRDR